MFCFLTSFVNSFQLSCASNRWRVICYSRISRICCLSKPIMRDGSDDWTGRVTNWSWFLLKFSCTGLAVLFKCASMSSPYDNYFIPLVLRTSALEKSSPFTTSWILTRIGLPIGLRLPPDPGVTDLLFCVEIFCGVTFYMCFFSILGS